MEKETPLSLWQRFSVELVGTYLLVVFLIASYFISMVAALSKYTRSGCALKIGNELFIKRVI
jgi:hypothetical protein